MSERIIKAIQYMCDVCGHKWQSKDGKKPLRCAGCKTPYWNKPK